MIRLIDLHIRKGFGINHLIVEEDVKDLSIGYFRVEILYG